MCTIKELAGLTMAAIEQEQHMAAKGFAQGIEAKVMTMINICKLNTYFETKTRLSGWRKNQIASLNDIKATCIL